MLTSCAVASFCFGIFYGFVLLTDSPNLRKYLLGLWQFRSGKSLAMAVLVGLVCAVAPAYLLSYISKDVHWPIVKYAILCLSSLELGLGISYFAPLVAHRLKLLVYSPEFPGHEDSGSKLSELV
jgi:hypothetical protein